MICQNLFYLLCHLKIIIVNFACIYVCLWLYLCACCVYVYICVFVCLPTSTGATIKIRIFWEVVNAKAVIQEAYSKPSWAFKMGLFVKKKFTTESHELFSRKTPAVSYFGKKLWLRCTTEFWTRLKSLFLRLVSLEILESWQTQYPSL